MSASEIKKCPKCGAKAERQLSRSAIQFKGSGWYVTDYAGKKGDGGSGEKPAGDTTGKPAEKSDETSKSSEPSSTPSSETKKSSSGKGSGKSKK
jgi:predicted nucleic acid-binding Zn ribbon protein